MLDRSPGENFGALLRELRTAAGLTQEALADQAGLSVRGIYHLEARGVRPRRATVALLADALGLHGPERAAFESLAAPASSHAGVEPAPPPEAPRPLYVVPRSAPADVAPEDGAARPAVPGGLVCWSCAAACSPGGRYCFACGARLILSCAGCGQDAPRGHRFCSACGQPLDDLPDRPAATTTPAPMAPGTVEAAPVPATETATLPLAGVPGLPAHLAARIAAERDRLPGERKVVTVLSMELVLPAAAGSAPDPEESEAVLNAARDLLARTVFQHEGTVNELYPEGLMALFGAPLAHEDHALRACRAAVAARDAIRLLGVETRSTYGIGVELRAGLASGEVVVRSLDADHHLAFSASGQTVSLAARLEQAAEPGVVLAAPDLLRLVEGYVDVRPAEPVAIAGLPAPIVPIALVGVAAARDRLQARAGRGLTRFVGRDAELLMLDRALAQGSAGHGQVVALVGEPGVGKSRIVHELLMSPRVDGWATLPSRSAAHDRATAYRPIADLIRAWCGAEPEDDAATVRDRVGARLRALDAALLPLLTPLLALLDVEQDALAAIDATWGALDPTWGSLDPVRRRHLLLDATVQVLLRASREQPILVVVEDLHWVDPDSASILDALVARLPTARMVMLVTYRPEYRHAWGTRSYYTQYPVGPLTPAHAEALLDELLGVGPDLAELRALLVDRTGGNPLFLEESVRDLVESGALVGERGAYRQISDRPSVQVPATVQAVLAARIDRLSGFDKQVLQAASAIGEEVPHGLLADTVAALGILPAADAGPADAGPAGDDPLTAALARLQGDELLYDTGRVPERSFAFKHALSREVTYASLVRARRTRLHGIIAEALLGRAGAVPLAAWPAEQIERLADHAARGERWELALDACRRAGERASVLSVYRDAVSWFDRALEAIDHLPASRTRMEEAVDIRLTLRSSLFALGRLDSVLDRLQEAETLAEQLGDERRLGWVSSFLCSSFWHVGEFGRAAKLGWRAIEIARRVGDVELEVDARNRLSNVYFDQGDFRQTVDLCRANIAMIEAGHLDGRWLQSVPIALLARQYLAYSLSELGQWREGFAQADEALRMAEAGRNAFGVTLAATALGMLHLVKGEHEDAVTMLRRAYDACRSAEVRQWYLTSTSNLGLALVRAGRTAEGRAMLSESWEARGDVRYCVKPLHAGWLAEAWLAEGHLDAALAWVERCLALTREAGERGYESWGLRLLGEVAARRSPPDVQTAETAFRRAIVQAQELGMRPLQAHCHAGLGRLYRQIGHVDASAEIARASALYRELEMTRWLPV